MTDGNSLSEVERAVATVAECELQLRRAQQGVRWACEMLRRAIRVSDTAEADLRHAARRLERMDPMARAGGVAPSDDQARCRPAVTWAPGDPRA